VNWLERWRDRRGARRRDGAYRRLWQAFTRYPTLADGRHDDEVWRAHDGRFAGCLIRVPAERLKPELDQVRSALDRPSEIRLHPDHFLHIMIQEIGFVCRTASRPDELTIERFDELSTALTTALNDIAGFEVTVGSANSFEDAAFLEIRDHGGCEAIHRRLREVAAVPMIPRYAFLPHMTMAHYLGSFDSLPMVKALQPFRDVQFGTFQVSEVEIVTMRVDIDYPPLYTTRKLKLGK
jgi:RNA 2',3'-cyclic 3'-phosphodiesterase